jgi:hypothetical protein
MVIVVAEILVIVHRVRFKKSTAFRRLDLPPSSGVTGLIRALSSVPSIVGRDYKMKMYCSVVRIFYYFIVFNCGIFIAKLPGPRSLRNSPVWCPSKKNRPHLFYSQKFAWVIEEGIVRVIG